MFMKRLHSIFSILIVLIIFAGCGADSGNSRASSNVMDADFFNRKIEGEITISVFDSGSYRDFLVEAADAFKKRFPGAKVNIETFSVMPEVRTAQGQGNTAISTSIGQDDPQSRNDYLTRINTNIMSGAGADIYAMDIIPLHKFIESGAMENLELYMNLDPDFNKADYRQNIFDALRYQNGIWFLPVNYFFRYYAYDSTLVPVEVAQRFGADKVWSTQELFNLGIPLYDGSYKLFNMMDFVPDGGLFYQLLNENMASFINFETGRPNFADGKFASLLSLVKDYGLKGYVPRGIIGQQDVELEHVLASFNNPDRYFFKRTNNLVSQFTRRFGNTSGGVSGGMLFAIDSDDEIAGIQANADGSVPFGYYQAFGINSQSKNKETAWAFMKFLLSKEMQLSGNPFFLPLHNEAREEKARFALFMGYPVSYELNEQQTQALEEYKAAVETLSDSINFFSLRDTNINDMITQEAMYFFEGSRNADETARVLQNKADLYLSE